MTTATETGLFNIHTEDIQFVGGFSDEVSPLRSNKGMPVIVLETEDGYRLIDGWGRVSGLLNAGAELTQAICISEEDFAERTTTGDDEEWNAEMYARYAPQYTYAGTTN
ncbi:MAG: hypothetical protein ACK6EB_43880 [Planctomyces sp.]|jgi:hypothetical protein